MLTKSRELAVRVAERVAYDVPRLYRTVGLRASLKYGARAALNAPAVARRGSLAPVDFAMAETLPLRFHGMTINIPVAAMDSATSGFDPTPTFGGVREMFVQDCYLRGFTSLPVGGTVLDLGANRGMFDLIALKVLKADHVIAVEPNVGFAPVGELLLKANGIESDAVTRRNGYAAPAGSEFADAPTVTMTELSSGVPGGRFSFCKMDIEGGEFALAAERHLLQMCDTIAAEVHPFGGSVNHLVSQFREAGFEVSLGDRFGRACPMEAAEYLYASRVPGRVKG